MATIETVTDFLSSWTALDVYYGVFVLWALATFVALRRAPHLLARIRDDVSRLTAGLDWNVDRACRELRQPKWFDEE